MTFKAFSTLLSKQILSKWSRFLLASGGIMIGVWAITLTNGLSLGLNQTIVDAINSQQLAKEISVNKLEGELQFDKIPSFVAFGRDDIQKFNQIEGVDEALPRDYLSFFIKTPDNQGYKCVEENQKIQTLMAKNALKAPNITTTTETTKNTPEIPVEVQEFNSRCKEATTISNVYKNFYETHKNNWVGSTTAPKRGQIVSCFECGGLKLGEYLGAKTPEELLGKKINIELSQSIVTAKKGDSATVVEISQGQRAKINKSSTVEMEIIAVIDDRDSTGFSLTGVSENNLYLDFGYYLDSIKLANPDTDLQEVGFYESVVVLKDYTYLDSVLDKINNDGYYATSIAKFIITGINSIFTVQQVVLFAFGIIILIASVFGIIAIMTISVLERKKEIGILKAMGSKDSDIFWLFLFESGFLGLLGWALGNVLFYICAFAIQQGFAWFLDSNPTWKENLDAFNISDFAPIAPWWLLSLTLFISVLFTSISGLFPAISAARQNPVDVLRSE